MTPRPRRRSSFAPAAALAAVVFSAPATANASDGLSARVVLPSGVAAEGVRAWSLPFGAGAPAPLALAFGEAGGEEGAGTLVLDQPAGEEPLILQLLVRLGERDRRWFIPAEPGQSAYRLAEGPDAFESGASGLDLRPSRHGFRFVNAFRGSPLPGALGALGPQRGGYGLCGGMSFAAADYFVAGVAVPEEGSEPARGSPLYNYISLRQIESLGGVAAGAMRFARWMRMPDDTLWGTQMRTVGELRALRAELAAGRPAVLGLVYVGGDTPGEVWRNHQVLGYGYEARDGGEAIVRIYDPNYPGRDDVTIRARRVEVGSVVGEDDEAVPVEGAACALYVGERAVRRVRGFFLMPYTPATPPEGLSGALSR